MSEISTNEAENIYSNARIGIENNESNLTLYNNHFIDIGRDFEDEPSVILRSGFAVYSAGSTSWTNFLLAGGTTMGQRNIFENPTTGIFLNSNMDAIINGNLFEGNSMGIAVFNCSDHGISITENDFESFGTGILVLNASDAVLKINDNIFNIDASTGDPQTYGSVSYGYNAIKVQNNYSNILNLECNNNHMSNVFYGIHLRNLDGVNVTNTNVIVQDNIINNVFDILDLETFEFPHRGIWMENVNNSVISSNDIDWNDIPTSDLANIFTGIVVDQSEDNTIESNNLINLGTGIRFYSACSNTNLLCNWFGDSGGNSCFEGIYMLSSTMTPQGIPGSSSNDGIPWDNQWFNFDVSTNFRIASDPPPSTPVDWYFKDDEVPGTYNSYSPYLYSPNSVDAHDNQTGTSTCAHTFLSSALERSILFESIVNDEDEFLSYEAENKYYNREFTYQSIKKDTTIMYLDEPDDSLYQQFYNVFKTTNLAKLFEVTDFLKESNVAAAFDKIDAIDDSTTIESNRKLTLYIITSLLDENRDSLTTEERDQLLEIAYQTAIEGGEGVYEARALLNLDILDILGGGARQAQLYFNNSEKKKHSSLIKIYPNPSSGLFTIETNLNKNEMGLFILYDLMGKELQSINLTENEKLVSLDLSDFSDGHYYFKFRVNHKKLEFGKLVLIR